MYNAVITWPTLYSRWPHSERAKTKAIQSYYNTFIATGERPDIADIEESLNSYVSILVQNCATRALIVAPPRGCWADATYLRALLAPTLATRTKFIEKRSQVWREVCRYCEPLIADPRDDSFTDAVDELALGLYQLILAARHSAEVALPTIELVSASEWLLRRRDVKGEARARLSVLRALFAATDNMTNISTIEVRVGAESYVRKVLDEILDDTQFLEVSALRRFFSLSANLRAVRRDLRLLIATLTNKKRWSHLLRAAARPLQMITAGSVTGSVAANTLIDTLFSDAQQDRVLISKDLSIPAGFSAVLAKPSVCGSHTIHILPG